MNSQSEVIRSCRELRAAQITLSLGHQNLTRTSLARHRNEQDLNSLSVSDTARETVDASSSTSLPALRLRFYLQPIHSAAIEYGLQALGSAATLYELVS